MANKILCGIILITLGLIGILSGFFLAYYKVVGMCSIWWTGMGICAVSYTIGAIIIDKANQWLERSTIRWGSTSI